MDHDAARGRRARRRARPPACGSAPAVRRVRDIASGRRPRRARRVPPRRPERRVARVEVPRFQGHFSRPFLPRHVARIFARSIWVNHSCELVWRSFCVARRKFCLKCRHERFCTSSEQRPETGFAAEPVAHRRSRPRRPRVSRAHGGRHRSRHAPAGAAISARRWLFPKWWRAAILPKRAASEKRVIARARATE